MLLSEYGNEAQKRAILHENGPAIVLAGPGSGKTFVITRRICHLIEHMGVDPSHILVITFTKASAREMEQRFHTICEHEQNSVSFGTFHAVFYAILKEEGFISSKSLLSNRDKILILKQILRKNHDVLEGEEDILEQILSEFSDCKNRGGICDLYTPSTISKAKFTQYYQAYQKMIAIEGKLDFDDLVVACFALLQSNPSILQKWQDRFSYILIDEFQDINKLQYNTIRLLAGKSDNLFVVGDDDQTIYGFRGASPEMMLGFDADYPDNKLYILNRNYRCSADILKASVQVISANKNRYPKKLCAENATMSGFSMRTYESGKKQYACIAKEIRQLLRTVPELSLGDIAIIGRTTALFGEISFFLKELGIPNTYSGGKDFIVKKEIIKDFSAILRFADGEQDIRHFLRFMNKPNRNINREIIRNHVDVNDLMELHSDNEICRLKIKQLKNHLDKLVQLRPGGSVRYIWKVMKLEQYYEEKGQGMDICESIQRIEKLAASCDTNKELLDRLEGELCADSSNGGRDENGEKVQLVTIHGAKGLEYKVVFIPDCNEGVIPHKKAVAEAEIEEERRMLYVAMTRAKDYLQISYLTGSKDHPMKKSRFLQVIQ